jgi:hypothetical protein
MPPLSPLLPPALAGEAEAAEVGAASEAIDQSCRFVALAAAAVEGAVGASLL